MSGTPTRRHRRAIDGSHRLKPGRAIGVATLESHADRDREDHDRHNHEDQPLPHAQTHPIPDGGGGTQVKRSGLSADRDQPQTNAASNSNTTARMIEVVLTLSPSASPPPGLSGLSRHATWLPSLATAFVTLRATRKSLNCGFGVGARGFEPLTSSASKMSARRCDLHRWRSRQDPMSLERA
jgi:hypothetical protein